MLNSDKEFPDCFPEQFKKNILPKGSKNQELEVYRICKYANESHNFLSTYEETKLKLRVARADLNEEDCGIYSTSCHINRKFSEKMLKIFLRHYPKPYIAKGTIEPHTGPSQITKERIPKEKETHVDWWIYKNQKPWEYFEKGSDSNE